MKAFISYAHNDTIMLEMLHKHLAQLKREGLIQTWEDQEIAAGALFDDSISVALESSQVFIALLSPDYIASNYCYEKEFANAMKLQERGKLIIVPIILEPCDWHNTPFKRFKALPKDGKPISSWENRHTGFLDIVQNLRKLVSESGIKEEVTKNVTTTSRNYRIQKDFDSIQKIEFVEKSFQEIKEFLKRFQSEIQQLDNIKVKILRDTDKVFESILVNRNKIATEAQLKITTENQNHTIGMFTDEQTTISYSITKNDRPLNKSFTLSNDEYQLFWMEGSFFSGRSSQKFSTARELAELIWNDWLSSVGIL